MLKYLFKAGADSFYNRKKIVNLILMLFYDKTPKKNKDNHQESQGLRFGNLVCNTL